MADDIPAGWYPDARGTIRWWDGQRWTDHVREASRQTPTPMPGPAGPTVTEAAVEAVAAEAADEVAPAAAAPVMPPVVAPQVVDTPEEPESSNPTLAATPAWAPAPASTSSTTVFPARADHTGPLSEIHRPNTRISYPKSVEEEIAEDDDPGRRRYWLVTTAIALATFFLGMGLGGQTAQPRQASDPLPPAVGTEPSDIEALRQQLSDRQSELDERQQVLDEREADLDDRASDPSPSPSATDTATPRPDATATRIDGNDTVHIGYDVREGTYRTQGPDDPDFECEYTISRDEFGDDVISEDTATSATSVNLREGDWFESDDCQNWTRD